MELTEITKEESQHLDWFDGQVVPSFSEYTLKSLVSPGTGRLFYVKKTSNGQKVVNFYKAKCI